MAVVDTTESETTEVDERTRRAATEAMAVLPVAEDLYRVYSGADSDYLVDLREPACECADYEYRTPDGGCKHARRVLMSVGRQPIPSGVRVDPTLPRQREKLAGSEEVSE